MLGNPLEIHQSLKTKGAGAWYWKLPTATRQVAQGVQHLNVEHVEHVERLEEDDAEVF